MAAMTPKEFEESVKKKLAALKTTKLIFPAASKAHNALIERLFDKGVGGDNKDLGEYDSTPAYFSRKQFVKQGAFKPQGKKTAKAKQQGQTRRRNQLEAGNSYERKSMYLPFGYKQFRAIQGRQVGFVDLQLSGDLRRDFSTKLKVDGEWLEARVSRKINQDKVSGLSDKYGRDTFHHTKEEVAIFVEESTIALNKYLFS